MKIRGRNKFSNGGIMEHTVNLIAFNDVKLRVTNHCNANSCAYLIDLALALAMYDFSEAPSNWYPPFNHEDTILEWAKFCNDKKYTFTTQKIISDYKKGVTPYAYNLMIDYFC